MSEKMTSITLPGTSGFADWGYLDRQKMINAYRFIARRQKEEAEKILNAADEDFIVEQHTGIHVRRNIRRI
jgi:hypothetical protein